ncbi:MAG: phospholipase D family protein [Sulfuritalea sp.]|nr:phospholipase D family protein [Sulfuritalea sp.]
MKLIPSIIAVATIFLSAQPALARKSVINELAGEVVAAARSERPVTVSAQGTIEVAFSPNGGATDAVVRFIGEAKSSIRMAAYSLTSNPIGKALVEAKHRGVDIRLVIDKEHNGRRDSPNSVASFLAASGIPIRVDYAVSIQHQKTVTIDGASVLNGSLNFSAAAEHSNRESITIHRNNPELAKVFLKNWEVMWSESQDFRAPY